jgi:hypothetical protein
MKIAHELHEATVVSETTRELEEEGFGVVRVLGRGAFGQVGPGICARLPRCLLSSAAGDTVLAV